MGPDLVETPGLDTAEDEASIDSDSRSMFSATSPTETSSCMIEPDVSLAESDSRSAFLLTSLIDSATCKADWPAPRSA